MFLAQNNVPSVYIEQSRDFQLIGRILDCVVNGIKFDINSVVNINDTEHIQGYMLQYLKSKVGFFTEKDFTEKDLRVVLSAFPYIIRYKGSRLSIELAVNVFARINYITGDIIVQIINKELQEDTQKYVNKYEVHIFMENDDISKYDTSILEEIFRYILPPPYSVYFFPYKYDGGRRYIIRTKQVPTISDIVVYTPNTQNAMLRGSDENIQTVKDNHNYEYLVGSVDTGLQSGSEDEATTETSHIIEPDAKKNNSRLTGILLESTNKILLERNK